MNVTVIGSGNGGMAVAFDCAQQGHRVSLYSRAAHAHENIKAVAAKGGITSQGRLEGFARVAYSGTDIEAAMEGAEIIFVSGPRSPPSPSVTTSHLTCVPG